MEALDTAAVASAFADRSRVAMLDLLLDGREHPLGALAGVAGPAVAAVIPHGVAFVHDPAGGATLPTRLSVAELPKEAPRAALGRYSAAQQAEELEQLVALARVVASPAPAGAAPAGVVAGPTTTADRLAAWLLQQSQPAA